MICAPLERMSAYAEPPLPEEGGSNRSSVAASVTTVMVSCARLCFRWPAPFARLRPNSQSSPRLALFDPLRTLHRPDAFHNAVRQLTGLPIAELAAANHDERRARGQQLHPGHHAAPDRRHRCRRRAAAGWLAQKHPFLWCAHHPKPVMSCTFT